MAQIYAPNSKQLSKTRDQPIVWRISRRRRRQRLATKACTCWNLPSELEDELTGLSCAGQLCLIRGAECAAAAAAAASPACEPSIKWHCVLLRERPPAGGREGPARRRLPQTTLNRLNVPPPRLCCAAPFAAAGCGGGGGGATGPTGAPKPTK